MKFANIEMLFLIWAVPVLFLVFFYGMKRRKNILSRFASSKGLKAILPEGIANRRWTKAGLLLCVLLFISLALSGPQYGYKWQETERKGIDIIIALDCSRSMLATDISPTRLDRAKREVYDLLTMLDGDRAGLVAFAGTAFLQCPLTLDYEAFNIFLKSLTPDFLPVGGTDMIGAMSAALAGFDEKTNSEKAIILITDGENTGAGDPVEAAEDLKAAGVKLFCIGVGSGEGVPVPGAEGGFRKDSSGKIVLTRLDENMLKKIAVLTGGTYVRSVAGDMDLDAIYTNEIRGKMEAATLESGRKQIWEDRYQWILALAIIALMSELFLPSATKKVSVMGLLLLLVLRSPVQAGPAQEGFEAYKNGEYDKSLKLFIDAQLDDPDNPEILYNIGNAYYKVGDFESASNNFKSVLKSEKQSLRQKAFYNLGNTDYRKGDFENAIKNYEEALKINPDDTLAKQNIEYVRQVMAQKKEEQKQEQQDGDQKEDSEKKEGEDEQKNGSEQQDESEKQQQSQGDKSEGNKGKKEEPSPDYGDEMKENQSQGAEQKPSPDEEDQKEEKAGAAQPKPSEGGGEDAEDKKHAERVLNRLKDQPGRAMIPAYRERHVEKDW